MSWSPGDFSRPDFGIWDKAKRKFFTALVWVLLACIPATWAYLYKDELQGMFDKKVDKGKKKK